MPQINKKDGKDPIPTKLILTETGQYDLLYACELLVSF